MLSPGSRRTSGRGWRTTEFPMLVPDDGQIVCGLHLLDRPANHRGVRREHQFADDEQLVARVKRILHIHPHRRGRKDRRGQRGRGKGRVNVKPFSTLRARSASYIRMTTLIFGLRSRASSAISRLASSLSVQGMMASARATPALIRFSERRASVISNGMLTPSPSRQTALPGWLRWQQFHDRTSAVPG